MSNDAFNFKIVDGGFVYQTSDKVDEDEVQRAELKTQRAATTQELKDMEIALKVAAGTKSNCVVYI